MPPSSSPSHEQAPDEPTGGQPPAFDRQRARVLLLIPIAVCIGQAIVLLILGVGGLFADTDDRGAALAEALTLFVLAAGLLWMAVGLARLRGWARAPVIATELIVVLVALSWAGPTTRLGWTVGLPAAIALVVVLLPRVAQAMGSPADDESVDESGAQSDGNDRLDGS